MVFTLALAIVLALVSIGFLSKRHTLHNLERDGSFILAYQRAFGTWVKGQGVDAKLYEWLVANSGVAQRTLGRDGVVAMRRPFETDYMPHYPVLLNTIPEIRKEFIERNAWPTDNLGQMIDLANSCLLRFLGTQQVTFNNERRRLFNPVWLFAAGATAVFSMPFYLLSAFGVLSPDTATRIAGGAVMRLVAFLASIATIVSLLLQMRGT